MAFFDRIDAIGVGENHIQELQRLEKDEAERMIERYRLIRHELHKRLASLPEGTFSRQRAAGVLLQVERAIREMSSSLLDSIHSVTYDISGRGVDHLVEELQAFEEEFTGAAMPINVNAALIATDTTNFLFNKHQASIDAYSSNLRDLMAQRLQEGIVAERGLHEMVRGIGKFFLGEEWKILRIARTELHNIYGEAKLRGMSTLADGSVPGLMKALLHPLDHRTDEDSKYLAELNPVLPVDEPFRYKWAGKWREFMTPPDRPNDRAILVPYRPEWGPIREDSAFATVNG